MSRNLGRNISGKLGKKINEGISAEIFEWENNKKIIKLAKNKADRHAMLTEYSNSQTAWKKGLSVPQPLGVVEVYGRTGIIFERVYGYTLMKYFVNPYLRFSNNEGKIKGMNYEDIARITAKILSETHRKSIHNMPLQRKPIISSIQREEYLTTSEKKLVLDVLNRIPIRQKLCHGDPNLNNILIRNRDNKTLLIDWMYASIGNPEADLAEFIITMRYGKLPKSVPDEIKDYINSIREQMIKVFIDEYTKLSDITFEDIDSWIIPISARRLSVSIIGKAEKQLLVSEIRKKLKKYR